MSIVRGYPYAQKDFRPFVFILLTDGYDVLLYRWCLKIFFRGVHGDASPSRQRQKPQSTASISILMKNCVQTSFHETDRVVLRQSQNDAVASRVVEASSRSAHFRSSGSVAPLTLDAVVQLLRLISRKAGDGCLRRHGVRRRCSAPPARDRRGHRLQRPRFREVPGAPA